MSVDRKEEQLNAEKQLAETVQAFELFLRNARTLERTIGSLPEHLQRTIGAKLEARLSGKILEKGPVPNTPFDLLNGVLNSVKEIQEILEGSRAVPDAKLGSRSSPKVKAEEE